ncbi:hypothetical protein PANDA_006423 [Ailuropoda melanoleuca]|uniref:Uncharacterized protein n=1 Tax=Ailuropoda melanoleuca TaxID=9646 RepID=D2H884_AILME|nr:hypothetical protein PANDA_006423 [Ailuropoda melanoleuca]
MSAYIKGTESDLNGWAAGKEPSWKAAGGSSLDRHGLIYRFSHFSRSSRSNHALRLREERRKKERRKKKKERKKEERKKEERKRKKERKKKERKKERKKEEGKEERKKERKKEKAKKIELLQPLKKKERKTLLIQHQQHSGKFRDRMIKSSVAALPGAPLSQGQWQQHDIGGGGVAEPSRTRIQDGTGDIVSAQCHRLSEYCQTSKGVSAEYHS